MNTLIPKNPSRVEAKNGFVVVDGVYKKIKKAFKTVGGVYSLLWGNAVDVATMGISYTGTKSADKVVTMSGVQYRLLELTSSGTLTLDEEVNAEVWMCSGGAKGGTGKDNSTYTGVDAGNGGAGGKFIQYTSILAKSTVIKVAAAAGVSQVGDIKSTSTGCISGGGGGGGGKAAYYNNQQGTGGSEAGANTKPFADSYFTKYPCAGGGGGVASFDDYEMGGGGGGSATAKGATGQDGVYGKGGTHGGGNGGSITSAGENATYYGSGGGGGGIITIGQAGGAGYQGIVYIRIPLEQ